jgi:dihydroorotate dehydrogenase
LQSRFKNETGGLSGKPLLEISNQVLKNVFNLTKGQIPIIAVGGISSASDAYEKIKLGASMVQIYSAFIYQGFELVEKIKKDLDGMLRKDGFKNIKDAIGTKNQ